MLVLGRIAKDNLRASDDQGSSITLMDRATGVHIATVTICEIRGRWVSVGVEADYEIYVSRSELLEKKKAAHDE